MLWFEFSYICPFNRHPCQRIGHLSSAEFLFFCTWCWWPARAEKHSPVNSLAFPSSPNTPCFHMPVLASTFSLSQTSCTPSICTHHFCCPGLFVRQRAEWMSAYRTRSFSNTKDWISLALHGLRASTLSMRGIKRQLRTLHLAAAICFMHMHGQEVW